MQVPDLELMESEIPLQGNFHLVSSNYVGLMSGAGPDQNQTTRSGQVTDIDPVRSSL